MPQYIVPLSLDDNGMVDQTVGIMPRKLFINKSSESSIAIAFVVIDT